MSSLRVRDAWVGSLVGLMVLASSLAFTKTQARIETAAAQVRLRVRDRDGSPLVARVRVVRSWVERALAARFKPEQRVVSPEGLTLQLSPGSYRLYLSRGPEWSMASMDLALAPGEHLIREVTLVHQVSLPGWRAADLHVHTLESRDARERGGISARDLRAEGITLAACTDHNRIGRLDAGIDSVPGAEITTWEPEIGHFNAFPLRTLPRWQGATPAALFAELRTDPDVFVQINHPRLDDHISYFVLGGFDGGRFARPDFVPAAHGLEVWNGYQLAHLDAVHRLLADWRALRAQGHALVATGGSDSHGPGGHLAGYPRTYVRAARASELAPALKRGQAFVTNGPLLELRVDGKQVGETVLLAPGQQRVEVMIRVLAPSWMRVNELELWADEERVWRTAIEPSPAGHPLRYHARTRLPVGTKRSLQAVAHGGRGLDLLLGRGDVRPLAFTNPVTLRRPARP